MAGWSLVSPMTKALKNVDWHFVSTWVTIGFVCSMIVLTALALQKQQSTECYEVQLEMQSAAPNGQGGQVFTVPTETRAKFCVTPFTPENNKNDNGH